ncbi:MAG: SseB family protein [Nocardioidaceae bacterium]
MSGASPTPDTGEVPHAVASALASYAADEGSFADALAAVLDSRLLLALVEVPASTFAEPEGHDHHGHDDHQDAAPDHHHGDTAMAAVSIQRPDGLRGLLAFTGTEPLRRYDATARPLPVTGREAAETALRDGAAALLVDLAGPVRLVVDGEDLAGMAAGWTLGRVGERSVWIRPAAE